MVSEDRPTMQSTALTSPGRRHFLRLAAAAIPACLVNGEEPQGAGGALDFKISGDFGNAPLADVRAVLHSAASEIWKHCPATRWQTRGFFVFPHEGSPITLFDHTADQRVAIGLNCRDTFWAQFAYQFAHEFCHALAGHSNDWRKPRLKGKKPNHWLEESLCETASLFALRSMAKSWKTEAPYPNWKSFADALHRYAEERMEATRREFPDDRDFLRWFRAEEASLREHATQREKNNRIAVRLLPLFEEGPAGWEAMTFFNLGERGPDTPLAEHFRIWQHEAPEKLRPFVAKIAARFEEEVR
jgi:hypothetical protein